MVCLKYDSCLGLLAYDLPIYVLMQ